MNTLSTVVDPYCDKLLRSTGYPDGQTTISAIQRFYGRTTISCPFTLTAGQTWDVHVHTTPLHQKVSLRLGSQLGNIVNYSQTNRVFGPICIRYNHYNAAGSVIASQYFGLSTNDAVDSSYATLKMTRTVSLGFELHNTTPDLYKQGSLTVYRCNVVDQQFGGFTKAVADAELAAIPHSSRVIASFPGDIAAASQYPNTRTWEASEGVYAVALPAPVNPYGLSNFSNFMMQNIDDVKGLAMRAHAPGFTQSTVTWSPIANVGVISSRFTDANQSFTLDYRHVLESVPDPTDIVGVSYACTAPEYNKLFIQLYTLMFNSIPPGVPVGFNDAGEWARRIWKIAKSVLPDLINLLPPTARVIGTTLMPIGVKVVDKIIDKAVPKEKKPKSKAELLADSQVKSGRMLPAKRQ